MLAGAGSDGAHALAAIRQHGGMTLAQSGDDGQPLPGTPQSAAATGLVDHVLPVEAMPTGLLLRQAALLGVPVPPNPAAAATLDPDHFAEFCALLRHRTGHDFSQYKQPTLLRRIRRRMQAQNIATASEYLDVLRRDPQQVDLLFRALLIQVTQFMRDPAAFQVVRETVLPRLLEGKGAADTVRIWVPGCATGEEVYSLAILLRELLDRQKAKPRIQIFGTDLDNTAIITARAARYPRQALARLTQEQIAGCFVENGKTYDVVRAVREMCLFSVHSVTKDPPFSRLDMISCRNLLIYLGRDLQVRVLRSFHYALNPDGILFLGPSESVTQGGRMFAQPDKRHRIFERRAMASAVSGMVSVTGKATPAGLPAGVFAVEDTIDRNARRALEHLAPAYVVIDRAQEIVRFSGAAIGRYLEPSPGAASLNLLGIVRRTLRPAVRTAVRKAFAGRETIVEERLVLPLDGRNRVITLVVKPVADGKTDRELSSRRIPGCRTGR